MSSIAQYKQTVKTIIENHGGKVDIEFIDGITKQPTILRDDKGRDSLLELYEPVKLFFNGEKLAVSVGSYFMLDLERAKDVAVKLQVAIAIVEEINNAIAVTDEINKAIIVSKEKSENE